MYALTGKSQALANLDAIRIIKTLQADKRQPSTQEQETLARLSG
jgi:hypothetical protein